MALGSAGLTGTGGSHDLYVPEIWSKRIQAAFERNTIAKDDTLDLSILLNEMGGDIINVPKIANRSASTRSLTAVSQITPAGATEDDFNMNVQTWQHDPEFVSDALPAQTKIFQFSQIDGKMQQSLAVAFDTSIFANHSSLTTTAQGTDDGATIPSLDNLVDAMEALESNFVPRDGRVWNLGSKTFWDLHKNNVFTSSDFTSGKGVESGKIPMLLGVPVKMSQNVPDTANGSEINVLRHKEAYAFAVRIPARVRRQPNLDYMGETVVGDMLYGTGAYRPEAGVIVYGR
jgi:hypothetical protein